MDAASCGGQWGAGSGCRTLWWAAAAPRLISPLPRCTVEPLHYPCPLLYSPSPPPRATLPYTPTHTHTRRWAASVGVVELETGAEQCGRQWGSLRRVPQAAVGSWATGVGTTGSCGQQQCWRWVPQAAVGSEGARDGCRKLRWAATVLAMCAAGGGQGGVPQATVGSEGA